MEFENYKLIPSKSKRNHPQPALLAGWLTIPVLFAKVTPFTIIFRKI